MLPTPGPAADRTQAEALPAGLGPDETVNGDKAYLDMTAAAGTTAVIPSKSSRNVQRELDREAYGERNPIERFKGRIKEFRRVAAHCDKTAHNFLSSVRLAVRRFLFRRTANRSIESIV